MIVTYRVEIPRQLINKSREGEGLSQSVGTTTRTSPHQRGICHLPLSVADVGYVKIGR